MAMVECRECKKEVSTEAKTCPHCGVASPGAKKAAVGPLSGCLILILAGVCFANLPQSSSVSSSPSRATSSGVSAAERQRRDSIARAPKLEVSKWTWSQTAGGSFVEVEGAVKNLTTGQLRSVTAVVTFQDRSGDFITSDEALIEYNPILPGQTSPFKVLGRWNPAMHTARLEFKELLGGTIRHRDASK